MAFSGSDAASIKTRATLSDDGKYFVLNGSKVSAHGLGTRRVLLQVYRRRLCLLQRCHQSVSFEVSKLVKTNDVKKRTRVVLGPQRIEKHRQVQGTTCTKLLVRKVGTATQKFLHCIASSRSLASRQRWLVGWLVGLCCDSTGKPKSMFSPLSMPDFGGIFERNLDSELEIGLLGAFLLPETRAEYSLEEM